MLNMRGTVLRSFAMRSSRRPFSPPSGEHAAMLMLAGSVEHDNVHVVAVNDPFIAPDYAVCLRLAC